jgi:hypothetical protein
VVDEGGLAEFARTVFAPSFAGAAQMHGRNKGWLSNRSASAHRGRSVGGFRPKRSMSNGWAKASVQFARAKTISYPGMSVTMHGRSILTISLSVLVFACIGSAAAKLSRSAALQLVEAAIVRDHLVDLPLNCISFEFEDQESATELIIDVREIHNERCGGDLDVAPRITSFMVDLNTGRLQMEDYLTGGYKPIRSR